MNIVLVTTSRADFGIYLPLIEKLKQDTYFQLFLFAGGMHTSEKYGNSYQLIEKQGIEITELFEPVFGDSPAEIAQTCGRINISCSKIWEKYKSKLDLIFVLGDRYEMFATASSSIPFNIPLAHIHGGEVTKGAIDNKYRNALTSISDLHFTSHEVHSENAKRISNSQNVYNVGSLGIEAASIAEIIPINEFEDKFKVSVSKGFVLTTLHPETVDLNNNKKVEELILAFKEIPLKVLCTLPNADTEGGLIREAFLNYEREFPEKIICYENLGQVGYLSAMKYCKLLIGNTSSGIIESTFFEKGVINLGNRQEGRLAGNNVVHIPFDKASIINAFYALIEKKTDTFENPYGVGNSSEKILEILKKFKK